MAVFVTICEYVNESRVGETRIAGSSVNDSCYSDFTDILAFWSKENRQLPLNMEFTYISLLPLSSQTMRPTCLAQNKPNFRLFFA